MTTTTTYATDNRWSSGGADVELPANAPAVYSARWIDQGDFTPADIVPDRQGFAYNDRADRDRLIDCLQANDHRIRSMGTFDRDVVYEVDVTEGDKWRIFQRRAGGYVYVCAWLLP
jgi:hypothetical protein